MDFNTSFKPGDPVACELLWVPDVQYKSGDHERPGQSLPARLPCPGALGHRGKSSGLDFSPGGRSATKRHVTISADIFGCPNLVWGVLLASHGWRSGLLLNILQDSGQLLPTTKTGPCPNVSSVEAEKPHVPRALTSLGRKARICETEIVTEFQQVRVRSHM